MKNKIIIIISVFLFGNNLIHSQNFSPAEKKKLDSLNFIINNPKSHDTTKAISYVALSDILYVSNPDTIYYLCTKAIKIVESNKWGQKNVYSIHVNALNNLAFYYQFTGKLDSAVAIYMRGLKINEKAKDLKIEAAIKTNLGILYSYMGENDKSLKYHNECIDIWKKLNDNENLGNTYNNIGFVYYNLGEFNKTLEFFNRALKLRETNGGDKTQITALYNNIASVYKDQKEYNTAIEWYEKAIKKAKEQNDKKIEAYALINIALIHREKKEFDLAMKKFKKSLTLSKEVNYINGIALSNYNVGGIYAFLNQKDSAIPYLNKAIEIQTSINDNKGLSDSYCQLAKLYSDLGSDEALHYALKAYEIANKIGFVEPQKNSKRILYLIYKRKGLWKDALESYETFQMLTDSLTNDDTKKTMMRNQAKYEFEKKEMLAKAEQAKKDELAAKEKEKQNIVIYAVSIGLFMVLFFLIMLYNRFKTTQKQKIIIEQQKHLVEEKHKEITDSINYAERIQRSFLATKEHLNSNLNEYFILFKPKDVVSGDFYWSATLNNGLFALVTADSTGHGVPGAIMSLLNIGGIEKAIETYTSPADILNSTRKTIIERLKKDGSSEGGKDGMDASLCVFDFKNKKLTIAAANNPVWIVRRKKADVLEATDYEVLEIKPDKMPIGKHDKDSISFTQQEIDLQSGDVIYTLTDGFPDQFGGPNGKKFMSKKLRELLAVNAHLSMSEQKKVLEQAFASWVGNMEQVDDVTLIGIRV